MLAYIKGTILAKRNNFAIIRGNELGYKVFLSQKILEQFSIGQTAEIYLYENIKEDGDDLYGFKTLDELEFFEMLLSVSGVGPKSALNILNIATLRELKDAIALGDYTMLTKVSGIGQKTAERLVLELRNKVDSLAIGDSSAKSDEIDALVALGYSLASAREAMKGVDPAIADSGERIRQALRRIKN